MTYKLFLCKTVKPINSLLLPIMNSYRGLEYYFYYMVLLFTSIYSKPLLLLTIFGLVPLLILFALFHYYYL